MTDDKGQITGFSLGAALEDSIMRKGCPVAAGSRIMEGFVSPIDATVVTRLEVAGISITGKTKMDEFGAAGLFAACTASSPTPRHCEERSDVAIQTPEPLHSAVEAVADGAASFALCNDYTGAVGYEAAAKGLCYIHPTYGTVSRYGLIPAVPSMDQIGIVCKTPEDGFRALSVIAGHDPKDGAMLFDRGQGSGVRGQGTKAAGELRLGVPTKLLGRVQDSPSSAVETFVKAFETVDIELKHFDVYTQVMQILCCGELSNNISRYDGVKFGYRADGYSDLRELYTKTRTEAFGAYAKLAAIMGAMVLSQGNYTRYYDKAMRIRRLIKESLEFDKYDAIVVTLFQGSGVRDQGSGVDGGCVDSLAHGCPLALQALPRLCGLPALTVPCGGGAITLIADAGCEGILNALCGAQGIRD